MNLLPGVEAHSITTSRLRTHYYRSGPSDGIPVVMIHGNLSTGRFYEHLWGDAPDRYLFIAPDMRSFGRSDPAPIDATRGLDDWADDTRALVEALGIDTPPHLVGWSTGGAAIASYAMRHPAASLTFIDPVSPFGFGGTHRDGTPCYPDWAGTGGGTANPDYSQRLASGDRSSEAPVSPRSVMNSAYWSTEFRLPEEREEILLDEVLLSGSRSSQTPAEAVKRPNPRGLMKLQSFTPRLTTISPCSRPPGMVSCSRPRMSSPRTPRLSSRSNSPAVSTSVSVAVVMSASSPTWLDQPTKDRWSRATLRIPSSPTQPATQVALAAPSAGAYRLPCLET